MSNGPQPNATNGGILPPTGDSVENCTLVSDYCPVEFTIYGYYPSLGANAFFCAIFFLCCFVNLVQGIRYKTWTFMIALTLGSLCEGIGYIGRILLNNNPWSSPGFETQICCLIIAPAFIAAGIYLLLKHVVIELGPAFSPLRPTFYTWLFILCDLISLVIQGAGGGIAATATNNANTQQIGNNMMIAGIVWQVVTLLAFGGLVANYAASVYRHRSELEVAATSLLRSTKFRVFVAAVVVSYITIFTRCVYRIAEMAHGWESPIMQDETDFIVLDGVMVALATVLMTCCHPGVFFKEMQMHTTVKKSGEKSGSGSDVEFGIEGEERKVKKGGWFGSK